MNRPVLSVVDYEAWNKGYCPPSEHVLIDQLSYRGAKVVLSFDYGDQAFWVVIRGKRPTRRFLRQVQDALLMYDKEIIEEKTEEKTDD